MSYMSISYMSIFMNRLNHLLFVVKKFRIFLLEKLNYKHDICKKKYLKSM